MASNDRLPGGQRQRPDVAAAAHAAAGWARARRATWTDRPLETVATASDSSHAHVSLPSPEAPPPVPLAQVETLDTGPSRTARTAEWLRAFGPPAGRWLFRAAVAGTLGTAVVIAGQYIWNMASSPTVRTKVLEELQINPPASATKTTGTLHVTSTPPGAQVILDGKVRGVTPLTIDDVSAGRHGVELKSDAGSTRRTVTVAADATVDVNELIFSGWLAVRSPIDLVITEGGQRLSLDDRHEIMLPPGRHELRLVNQAFAYNVVRQVELKPGETSTLNVTLPLSTMTVTATETAEVWLDGAQVGETPLTALPVQIGGHEIVVKRAGGEERRFTITVTTAPVILNADFSTPPS